MVSRQIVVGIDQDSTDTSKGNERYVADEEAGPERWAQAKTVGTHTCVNIREIHKTEEYGTRQR